MGHRRCGKLIVATDEAQIAALEQLRRHALANGVDDLQSLDGREVLVLEPEVQAVAGLLSPSTGIIDSHALMLALLGDAERHGAVLALNAPVTAITVGSAGLQVEVGGADPLQLLARTVVNCAGHGAPILAAHTAGLDPAARPRQFFAKGSYFSLSGRTPFRHLVYPLPEPGGLGVHLTLDLAGQARFGPDVQWVEDLNYRIEPERAEGFYAAIRRYWPALPDASLQPAYTGIRPKISGPGEAAADFRIDGPAQHGVAALESTSAPLTSVSHRGWDRGDAHQRWTATHLAPSSSGIGLSAQPHASSETLITKHPPACCAIAEAAWCRMPPPIASPSDVSLTPKLAQR